MKHFRIFCIVFLVFESAFGAFNEPLVLKQITEDGTQFVFLRKEGSPPWNGITIKDPHTKVILYEVKVTKCSPASCVGSIVRNHSGIKLRTDEEYIHSYNETPSKYDTKDSNLPEPEVQPESAPIVEGVKEEPKIEPAPAPKPLPVISEKPKPQARPAPRAKVKSSPEPPSALDRAIYISYGSPVGPGIKIGYFKQYEVGWMGVNYGNISSAANNVSIKGHLLSGAGSFTVLKPTSSIDVNLAGEAGLIKATLDFTAVDSDGPVKEETSYYLAMAGEGKLNFERFSLVIKSGFSKTGLAASYTGTFSKFNNPYGAILAFLEVGAYYRF